MNYRIEHRDGRWMVIPPDGAAEFPRLATAFELELWQALETARETELRRVSA